MLRFKRRPAWWIAGVAAVLATLYLLAYADRDFLVANRIASVTTGSFLLLFSCATASLSSAIEAGRERESRGVFENSRRPFIAQILERTWPGILSGVLVQLAGVAILLVLAGSSDRGIPWFLIVGQVLAVVMHGMLGYALGVWLRPVLAIPLSVVVPYVWIGATWSIDFFGIRYLAGLAFEGCCTPVSVLDTNAVAGFIVFSAVATVACFLAINSHRYSRQRDFPRTWVRASGSALVLIVGLVLGLGLTAGVGPNPDSPRPTTELVCDQSEPQVCFFPGQFSRNDNRAVYANVFSQANETGLPKVVRIESTADSSILMAGPNGDWTVNVVAQPTFDVYDSALAAASSYAAHVVNTDCSDDNVHAQMSAVTAWLWVKGLQASGVRTDVEDAKAILDPSAETTLQRLLQANKSEAGAWVARTFDSATRCERPKPFAS